MLQFIKEDEEFLGRRKVINLRSNPENPKHLGNGISINIKKSLHHVSHLWLWFN